MTLPDKPYIGSANADKIHFLVNIVIRMHSQYS